MKNLSLKSLVLGAMALVATVSANAGDGTSGNPYKVCATSNFKLTTDEVTGATYQWYNAASGGGMGTAITNANGRVLELSASNVSAVTTTSYFVTVTSSQGCTSTAGQFFVTAIPAPAVTASADDNFICGNTPQTINLEATATMPNLPLGVTFGYAWTGSTGVGLIATPTAMQATTPSPATAGAYTYTATVTYGGLDVNGSGCTVAATTTVNVGAVPATPTASISAN